MEGKGQELEALCSYPVLGPGVIENPGTSMPVFTALPLATPAPGPAHGPPLMIVVVPPGGPPVPSAFPGPLWWQDRMAVSRMGLGLPMSLSR
ncbi:NUT family member 2F [Plecturocebus cupreus]